MNVDGSAVGVNAGRRWRWSALRRHGRADL